MPTDAALLHALAREIAAMPPLAAMGVELRGFDGQRLRLAAPLSRNVNDKGCAFGGSLNSVMTIAAWGLAWLALAARGQRADTYVQDSTIRYLAPLFGDLEAEAWLAEGDWDGFTAQLAGRGRARALIAAEIALPRGGPAATFSGRFVAVAAKKDLGKMGTEDIKPA